MVVLSRADESSALQRHRRHQRGNQSDAGDAANSRSDGPGLEELNTAFHVFDANSDGFIDASELRSAMHELTGDDLTDADVSAMIRSADRDGDGRINYDGKF